MMDIRRAQLFLLAAICLLAGCRKSPSAENTSSASSSASKPAPAPSFRTTARIHWLGMTRVSRETNAASLMAVWNLPESRQLEQQTLDKLSQAPWRLLHQGIDTNAAALLRPLLDEVVSNESCLEIRQATNQPDQLAFAIRLDDRRAAWWQTNLAAVMASLTGIHPVPAPDHHYGWSLKKHHAPDLIELTRVGEWTVIGAAQDQNPLLAELKSRIQSGQPPVTVGHSNDWLAAGFVPAHLIPRLGTWNLELGTWNRLDLSVTGDGADVVTHARADFSRPLALDLKPWDIPTNLISEPLSSLTAIRGFKPWLGSLKFWHNLQIGPAPDQIYFWAQAGNLPMLSYFAAPLPDASNEMDRLADRVLKDQVHWFPTNHPAKFERSSTFNGLGWKGLPYLSPFLRSITVHHRNFIYGGAFPAARETPLSLRLLQPVLSRTNLLYHGWEITGLRIDQWLYLGQFTRFVTGKAQLPSKSPGLLWLKAIAPKLRMSLTDITRTGPDQLAFTRKSGIGFTAIELNLLADWLESPQFPIGLHTLNAPPPLGPRK